MIRKGPYSCQLHTALPHRQGEGLFWGEGGGGVGNWFCLGLRNANSTFRQVRLHVRISQAPYTRDERVREHLLFSRSAGTRTCAAIHLYQEEEGRKENPLMSLKSPQSLARSREITRSISRKAAGMAGKKKREKKESIATWIGRG